MDKIVKMPRPSDLMSDEYYQDPSKMIALSDIPNKNGFKFIGIDKHGGEHYCIVRKREDTYYMCSNTVLFQDLIGWLPDKGLQAAAAESENVRAL